EPMCRLTSWTTDSGSVASDSRATAPTIAWPESNRTMDGVVGEPSAFGSTTGAPAPLTCATTDIVVPRSIPNAVFSATAHAPAPTLPVQSPHRDGKGRGGEHKQRDPVADQADRGMWVQAGGLVQQLRIQPGDAA